MLFRCSVCKGEFEVEPDPNRPMIFCTHCGATLRTGRPGMRGGGSSGGGVFYAAPASADSALSALTGEPPAAPPPPAAYAASTPGPAGAYDDPTSIDPPISDSLGALMQGETAAPAYRAVVRPRNFHRKKDIGLGLLLIVVGGFVFVVLAAVILIVVVNRQPEERKPRPAKASNVGELFPEKSPSQDRRPGKSSGDAGGD